MSIRNTCSCLAIAASALIPFGASAAQAAPVKNGSMGPAGDRSTTSWQRTAIT